MLVLARSATDVEISPKHHVVEFVFLGYTMIDLISVIPGAVYRICGHCMQPRTSPDLEKILFTADQPHLYDTLLEVLLV